MSSSITALVAGKITHEALQFLREHGADIRTVGPYYQDGTLYILKFPTATQVDGSGWEYYIDLPGVADHDGITPTIKVELDIDTSRTKVELAKQFS